MVMKKKNQKEKEELADIEKDDENDDPEYIGFMMEEEEDVANRILSKSKILLVLYSNE